MDQVLYEGSIFSTHAQVGLYDVQYAFEGSYPEFETGEEEVVFGPRGVVVATAPDVDLAIAVYMREARCPDLKLIASGKIDVGDKGLAVGNVSVDHNFPWPEGVTSVSIYANAAIREASKIVFLLVSPGDQ